LSITYKLKMFAVAITLTSALVGLSFAAVSNLERLETVQVTASIVLIVAFVAIPVVSVLGLVFAMPIAFLLNHVGVRGYLAWAAVGLIVGVAVCVLLSVLLSGGSISDWAVRDILFWAAIGAFPGLGAGLFWWRAVAQFEQSPRTAA